MLGFGHGPRGPLGLGETFGIGIRSGQDGGVGVIGPSPVRPLVQ